MRATRMAAMAAAAVFVAGCSEQKSVTDLASRDANTISLAPGSGSAASFTTINDPGTCGNGSGQVNCNQYASREDVYLNGGPAGASLDLGSYFWVVLTPSGQNSALEDGLEKNLSDKTAFGANDAGGGDLRANRTFSIELVNGVKTFVYNGTHAVGSLPSLIQLAPFDKTGNNGGVYTLAICKVNDDNSIGKCKFDAFKVDGDATNGGDNFLAAPVPTKTATGAYKRTYNWSISKSVDKTSVSTTAATATFNYTVVAAQTGVTESDFIITGTIKVLNPNNDAIVVNVADTVGTTGCEVTGGTDATLVPGDNSFEYTCKLSGKPADLANVTNTAFVSWEEQSIPDSDPLRVLQAGTATFEFPNVPFTVTETNKSVTVTDAFNGGTAGTLGTLVGTDADPFAKQTFTYARTINVTPNRCDYYSNTATITETSQTASQTVTVCGPATSGLTIGFWQNPNGQTVIKNAGATNGVCNLTPVLRTYLPLQDLAATATCTQAASYVTNVVKAANASGASMNAMLKAQFMATALSVYFSSTGAIPGPTLGPIKIDLTKVCVLSSVDCSVTQNVSSAFGGTASRTVSSMLTYAASQSNAGGSFWYNQIKATQELAKNAFDVINNKKAFVAP